MMAMLQCLTVVRQCVTAAVIAAARTRNATRTRLKCTPNTRYTTPALSTSTFVQLYSTLLLASRKHTRLHHLTRDATPRSSRLSRSHSGIGCTTVSIRLSRRHVAARVAVAAVAVVGYMGLYVSECRWYKAAGRPRNATRTRLRCSPNTHFGHAL